MQKSTSPLRLPVINHCSIQAYQSNNLDQKWIYNLENLSIVLADYDSGLYREYDH